MSRLQSLSLPCLHYGIYNLQTSSAALAPVLLTLSVSPFQGPAQNKQRVRSGVLQGCQPLHLPRSTLRSEGLPPSRPVIGQLLRNRFPPNVPDRYHSTELSLDSRHLIPHPRSRYRRVDPRGTLDAYNLLLRASLFFASTPALFSESSSTLLNTYRW